MYPSKGIIIVYCFLLINAIRFIWHISNKNKLTTTNHLKYTGKLMHPYVADKLIDVVSLVILSVNDVGNKVKLSSLISKK